MIIKFKKISITNILITLIAIFFLIVNLSNPGFGDTLWPVAAIGVLLMFLSFAAGLVVMILRFFISGSPLVHLDFSIGLLNFCFGLSWIITSAFQGFEASSFIVIIPLIVVGSAILLDIFLSSPKAKK